MTEAFIGEIKLFGYNFAQRGYALCSGQLLSIQQNAALFSLLGTTYGGNGVQTFALPDLRGRTAVGQGQGPGLGGVILGQVDGTETVTLNSNQIPTHIHQLEGSTSTATRRAVAGALFSADAVVDVDYYAPYAAATQTPLATATIASAGGAQPHSNMQPYLVLNYAIALQGVFPSRN